MSTDDEGTRAAFRKMRQFSNPSRPFVRARQHVVPTAAPGKKHSAGAPPNGDGDPSQIDGPLRRRHRAGCSTPIWGNSSSRFVCTEDRSSDSSPPCARRRVRNADVRTAVHSTTGQRCWHLVQARPSMIGNDQKTELGRFNIRRRESLPSSSIQA